MDAKSPTHLPPTHIIDVGSADVRPIAPEAAFALIQRFAGAQLLDIRREEAFAKADTSLPGALRRDPETAFAWADRLDPHRPVIAACVWGHNVSQGVAHELARRGLDARYLEGGMAAWQALGLPTAPKPKPPSLWVTRARPKVDRVACPWFIRRFVDADARFVFVAPSAVTATAAATGGTAFDIPGAPYTHAALADGSEGCSFDAFVARHRPDDPALATLARIVRGADTSRPDLHPAAGGLFAAALGLSALIDDDHALLRLAFPMYDALYLWCRDLQQETHTWPPKV
jgi:rhodanese-related sulfurtransferase